MLTLRTPDPEYDAGSGNKEGRRVCCDQWKQPPIRTCRHPQPPRQTRKLAKYSDRDNHRHAERRKHAPQTNQSAAPKAPCMSHPTWKPLPKVPCAPQVGRPYQYNKQHHPRRPKTPSQTNGLKRGARTGCRLGQDSLRAPPAAAPGAPERPPKKRGNAHRWPNIVRLGYVTRCPEACTP